MKKEASLPITGLKILIVEDEEINRFVLEKLLSTSGCDFSFCRSGEEALIANENSVFDVILLDIELPGMNGYETAASITKNKHPESKGPLLIAMTGHPQPDEQSTLLDHGMNGWIIKPFGVEQLTHVIQKTRESAETYLQKKEPIIKLDLLNSIAGDDPAFVTICMELFLKEMPENLERLNTAIEEMDWETIRTTSHKMKTSLNYMGLNEQRLAAATIEKLAREKRDLDRVRTDAGRITSGCIEAFIELREILQKHKEAKP